MANARVEMRLKQAGRVGARTGMALKDNPFPVGTSTHAAWQAGYEEQKALVKKGMENARKNRRTARKAAEKKASAGKKPTKKKASGSGKPKKKAAAGNQTQATEIAES